MRLSAKTALITGAGKGIGEACARLFAREGARVIVSDIDDANGRRVCDDILAAGGEALYYHLDVAEESQWQQLMARLQQQPGQLDILVNNAGIIGFDELPGSHDPEHMAMSSWRRIQQINADSVAMGCKYALALLKQSPAASIINMSSRSGIVGIPGAAPYAASKATIRNHSKTVALYCAQQGYPVRCNSIHPGAILTPLWDAMLGDDKDQAIDELGKSIPLGHMGEPMDVAYAALYLASDEAKYVTGIELNVDGGILAGSSAAPGK